MRDALLAAALHHRAASCLLAAEICYRAALSAEAICASCANAFLDDSRYCRRCGSARPAAADLWFGLSTVLLERGAFAAAKLSSPAPVGTNNHGATQRAAHTALYYRSLVA